MKYIVIIIAGASILTACDQSVKGKNGVVYKSAVQYNNYIINRQTNLMKDLMSMEAVSQTDLDSADKILDKILIETEEIIFDIKGMPPYNGDSSFRDAAINSFLFYKKIFGAPYKRIIDIRRNHDDMTEEGVAELKDILDQMKREEEKFDKTFHNSQEKFAEKNHLGLKDNEVQKQIDESDK